MAIRAIGAEWISVKTKNRNSKKARRTDKTDRAFKRKPSPQQRAIAILRQRGGIIRRSEAPQVGIHPRTLYSLRDQGLIETVSRGVYRLRSAGPLGNPDRVAVAIRNPQMVICLISALAFHELTTQIPHAVYIALPRGAEPPRIDYPPVRTFWFSGRAFSEGIETHQVDGIPLRVYCREKTVADCFKYRHKIGTDVALEAIRDYLRQKNVNVQLLLHYAAICRVQNQIRPYLEALL